MQHWEIFMKTLARVIVASGKFSTQAFLCNTQYLNIANRDMYLNNTTAYIVVFQLQQWLRERVTVVCYIYIAYLVKF
jgi:hypothetical protein